MAYDGSGVFNRPVSSYVFDTVISETDVNAEMDGIATGLSTCITKDGQQTLTANIPWSGFKITGYGSSQSPSARTDVPQLGQVQDSAFVWCGTAGGTANAITLTPSPAIPAYKAGQKFRWIAGAADNTGAMTIAVSGLSAIGAQNDGAALVAGDHAAGKMYEGVYDGTQFQITRIRLGGVSGAAGGDLTGTYPDPTIANNAVTNAKLAQMAATTVKANATNATANAADLAASADGQILGRRSGSLTFAQVNLASEVTGILPSANGGRRIAQVVGNETGVMSAFGTTIPFDDTIPQNTEGTQVLSQSITPTNASSTLEIEAVMSCSDSAAEQVIAALFQDTGANAIAATASGTTAGSSVIITLKHRMTAGTTSTTTFAVRVGGSSGGTVTINGSGGARKFGGVSATSITITEILP